jgi:hypothetical protein
MQSECTAITPQFICSYAWKQPPVRPAIFQRAQKLLSRENLGADTSQAGPWKAYLAARERQHLASDIVEGFFSAQRELKPSSLVRPSILMTKPPAGRSAKGLLASVLPQNAASEEPAPAGSADLPIAA